MAAASRVRNMREAPGAAAGRRRRRDYRRVERV